MAVEEWNLIPGFPDYEMSSHGRVRNVETGRFMVLSRNQKGIRIVGLMLDGIQYKRSVPVIVANLFVPRHVHPSFNTPIHLDGDKDNCRADNLVWRPRWFARRYHQQFEKPPPRSGILEETHTGETYEDIRHAAKSLGLLEKDIILALAAKTYVWPTFQVFQELDTYT